MTNIFDRAGTIEQRVFSKNLIIERCHVFFVTSTITERSFPLIKFLMTDERMADLGVLAIECCIKINFINILDLLSIIIIEKVEVFFDQTNFALSFVFIQFLVLTYIVITVL